MSARSEIDKKNLQDINNILNEYPTLVKKYINSLSRKTTYTKKAYAYYIRNFLDYINNELGYSTKRNGNYKKIKPMDIDGYMESIRLNDEGEEKSATYRAANLAAINGFFKFLKKNGIVEMNPCETTEIPKDSSEHEIVTITDEDMEIMLENIRKGVGNHKARSTQKKWQSRDIALLRLGVSTGLRVSAICGIDIDDINLNEGYIKVTEKGDIEKTIYIGENTIKALAVWIEDRKKMVKDSEKALFICKTGHRISDESVQKRFKQISEGTGKHITPHKMRSTCATKLYEKTGDIYLVQQQLGHKSIKNTERYAKVSDQKKRMAADLLDSLYKD